MAVTFVRTIIIFITVLAFMRIMGKRQMGELELNELVVAVLISNLASQPLQDIGIPLLYGLLPALTLFCCEILISYGIMRSIKFRALICGKPSILIENGKIKQNSMRKNRFTLDELNEELRQNNVTDISTVKYAILETNGTLSILLYPDRTPLTPNHLALNVEDTGMPITIINNGRILDNNLKVMGLNQRWLQKQLKARNLNSAQQVYFMTVDKKENIYIAVKDH